MKNSGLIVFFFTIISLPSLAQCIATADDYSVSVSVFPVSVNTAATSCASGYNYDVTLDYSVVFSGANPPPAVWDLQGNLTCGSSNLSVTLSTTAGTGRATTAGNYTSMTNCATATPASLNCNSFTLLGSGPRNFSITSSPCNMASSPLPVRLTSFSGNYLNGANIVKWNIDDAVGFSHFSLQKSSDARSFETIANVTFETNKNEYFFMDKSINLSHLHSYYRLQMHDLDGTTNISKIISIEHFDPNMEWEVFPNPASENVGIHWNNDFFNLSTASLYSQTGTMLNYVSPTLDGFTSLNTSNISSGLYILQIQNIFGKKLSKKIVIKN